MLARWSRLAAALFLIGLLASRLSLVLHELVGHGAVATALGGQLSSYRLFLFGGGWVSYAWGPEHGVAASLAVSLGGVALEVVAAAVALLLARRARGPLARLALVGFAAADMLHAGFYLAVGAHHGFGDGRLLRAVLGGAAPAVVWTVVAATVVAGFLLARRLALLAGDWTGAATRAGRAGALVAAALAAGALHGGLTLAERAVTRDDTYARIMKPEAERRAEREAARLAREARRRGAPLDPAQLEAIRAELARRSRELPLAPILIAALVLACGAGVWRGLGAAPGAIGDASERGETARVLGATRGDAARVVGAESVEAARIVGATSGEAARVVDAASVEAARVVDAASVEAARVVGAASGDAAVVASQRGQAERDGVTGSRTPVVGIRPIGAAPSWRGLAPLGGVTAAALALVAVLRLFE